MPSPTGTTLIRELRRRLAEAADPEKAGPMQAYMKSVMPYRGVQTPGQRRIFREVCAAHVLESAADWRDSVLHLWRMAKYREERYGAIYLTGYKTYEPFQTTKTLPLYEEIIVTGAWWDYVDAIATHRLRTLLVRYPKTMAPRMRTWSRDPDMWKRRSSIICQVGLKEQTNLALLYECIEPNLDDREFFIRKAIGWALREYAWTDVDEVERYARRVGERLSPLSRREALKNVEKLRKGASRGRSAKR